MFASPFTDPATSDGGTIGVSKLKDETVSSPIFAFSPPRMHCLIRDRRFAFLGVSVPSQGAPLHHILTHIGSEFKYSDTVIVLAVRRATPQPVRNPALAERCGKRKSNSIGAARLPSQLRTNRSLTVSPPQFTTAKFVTLAFHLGQLKPWANASPTVTVVLFPFQLLLAWCKTQFHPMVRLPYTSWDVVAIIIFRFFAS